MKNKLILLAAVLAGAAACTKDAVNDDFTGAKYTINASTQETRTASGAGSSIVWSTNDAISVSYNGNVYRFGLTDGAGTKSAMFSGDVNLNGISYTAIYPYSVDGRVTLPAVQAYSSTLARDGAIGMLPMAAQGISNTAPFLHIAAVVKLKVYGKDQKVEKIEMTSNGKQLSGTGDVTWTNTTPALALDQAPTATTLTLDCSAAPVELNNSTATEFYFVVPAGSYDGISYKLYFTGGATATKSTTKTVAIAPGDLISFGDFTVDDTSYLVYYGDANCIVPEVIADGATGSFDVAAHATSSSVYYKYGAVTDVDCSDKNPTACNVIWDTGILKQVPTLSGTKLSYTLTGEKGNALVAVTDGTNTLWSFHIWATDEPVELLCAGGYSILDRNLGAVASKLPEVLAGNITDVIPCIGTLYQWGRKDPFLAKDQQNNTITKITMQEAILNPTLFVKVSEDWCSERDANYWGGGTGHKSVYDPCPAGYKVLKNSAIYELERPVDGIDTTYGRYIYYDEGENYCFFPYTGAIMNNAAMWYSGVAGYYPGSAELTDLSKMVTGFMWTDTEKTATMGKGLRYQAAVWQIEYDAGSKSHGLAVRCCKE